MKEQIWEYVVSLYRDIPLTDYVVMVIIFVLGIIILTVTYGIRKGTKITVGLLQVEYVFLLLSSTVIYRGTGSEDRYDFMPFWSYMCILEGRNDLIAENIMNIVVFIPVGLLIGTQKSCVPMVASDLRSSAQDGWLVAMGIGLLISVSIETLQYFMHRGFAEVDDVIHNTIGCVLGYILFKGLQVMVHRRAKRQSRAKN